MYFQNRNRAILIFLLSFFLVLFLPFSVKSEEVALFMSHHGQSFVPPPIVTTQSGYDYINLMILQILYFVTLILLVFKRSKVALIFGMIGSFINILVLPLIYVLLTFNIDIDPPFSTNSAGYGFYLLAILDVLLFVTTIRYLIRFPKKQKIDANLLDEINSAIN